MFNTQSNLGKLNQQGNKKNAAPTREAAFVVKGLLEGLLQFGFVKFLPTVEVVEVHGIEHLAIVNDAARAENTFAGLVVML